MIQEMMEEMLQMQRELDSYIIENGNSQPTFEQKRRALLDEIGELNHEDKASWCWWKKTQKPVDREKLLGEFVDCLHFALSITYQWFDARDEVYFFGDDDYDDWYRYDLSFQLATLPTYTDSLLEKLFYIGQAGFGFSIDEIYDAYMDKNKVNHERQDNGY